MTPTLSNGQEVSLSTMTPKLFNEEEEANITTIVNQQSILLTSNIGGKAIDRCSPHLKDPLREKSHNPLLSKPPKNPKTFHVVHSKAKKKALEKKPTTEYSSPASSQRYLLSDSNSEEFVEKEIVPSVIVNEFCSKVEESNFVLRPLEGLKLQNVKVEETNDIWASSSTSTSTTTTTTSSSRPQEQQVVVLRVSLHCKGCEGKVRKHISKMEGVTSFKTDLVNKKVTVIGDVTPLGVLNSISKVKNAQLWPSQPQAACY